MNRMNLLIVDIDGTIADIGPRLREAGIEPDRSDKVVFQAWLDRVQNDKTLAQDLPVVGMNYLLKCLEGLMIIVYLTGRSEKYRATTEAWLDERDFVPGALIMRGNDDWRPAAAYKKQHIEDLLTKHHPYATIAIDDDGAGDCAQVYQDLGITHLKMMNKWDIK